MMAKRGYISRIGGSNGDEETVAMHDRNNVTVWPGATERTKLTHTHTHTHTWITTKACTVTIVIVQTGVCIAAHTCEYDTMSLILFILVHHTNKLD
jgi:hypothetical protein